VKLQLFLRRLTVAGNAAYISSLWPRMQKGMAARPRHLGALMEKTLFEKYGGFSKISKIVLTFYDRMLEDDDVGPFFDDVDLPKLIDHQTQFISALMGGPATFSDDRIERAHRNMNIEHHHFDRLKEIVAETLADFDVAPADIEIVLEGFEHRRVLLVEKPNVD